MIFHDLRKRWYRSMPDMIIFLPLSQCDNPLTANNCINFWPGVYKETWGPHRLFLPPPPPPPPKKKKKKKNETKTNKKTKKNRDACTRKGNLVFGWLIVKYTPCLFIGYSIKPGLRMNGVLTKLWIFSYQRGQAIGQETRWFTILRHWSSLSNSWTIIASSKLWHSQCYGR